MPTNHTENYQLSQWERSDRILMEDFNSDNLNIERALRNHDSQLLGVPTLGRNLYNLFLQQKKAGQDVSWMQGLVYDDFSDQSKIGTLGENMVYPASEKCVIFTPAEDWGSSIMETAELDVDHLSGNAYAWIRCSTSLEPAMEVWNANNQKWVAMVRAAEWNVTAKNMNGVDCHESYLFLQNDLINKRKIKFRITLNSIPNYDVKLFDYALMIC